MKKHKEKERFPRIKPGKIKLQRDTLLASMFIISIGIMLYWFLPIFLVEGDMQYFTNVGTSIHYLLNGTTETFISAYPPLASLLFYTIWKIAVITQLHFAETWSITIVILLIGVTLFTKLFLTKTDRWTLAAGLIVTALLLNYRVVLARYDIFVTIPLFLAWRSYSAAKHGTGAFFLMIASALKIIPLVALPLLWILAPPKKRWHVTIGTMLGASIGFCLPLIMLGPQATLENIKYLSKFHEERGFQVESTWSGANMFINQLRKKTATIQFHHFAFHNESVNPIIAQAVRPLMLAGSAFIYANALVWRKKATPQTFNTLFFAILLWPLLVAPILSPQFFVWSIPLILAWLLKRIAAIKEIEPKTLLIGTLTLCIPLITQWVWPYHYDYFLQQQSLYLISLFNLRTILIAALIILLYREAYRTTTKGSQVAIKSHLSSQEQRKTLTTENQYQEA